MACEVLAFTFPCWQRYLGPGLLAVGRAGGAQPGKAPQDHTSWLVSTAFACEVLTVPELSAVEALERLALQALALYQEPHMTAAASALLMQVGNADVSTLLQVMGKAARRVDIGPAYASSALLVLQLFSQTSPNKVRPMLPRFAEALLRCLEPSDPQLRRSSLLAVTSALHELVGNFPMVDFHQESQKPRPHRVAEANVSGYVCPDAGKLGFKVWSDLYTRLSTGPNTYEPRDICTKATLYHPWFVEQGESSKKHELQMLQDVT
eukprot:s5587_g2.t2